MNKMNKKIQVHIIKKNGKTIYLNFIDEYALMKTLKRINAIKGLKLHLSMFEHFFNTTSIMAFNVMLVFRKLLKNSLIEEVIVFNTSIDEKIGLINNSKCNRIFYHGLLKRTTGSIIYKDIKI